MLTCLYGRNADVKSDYVYRQVLSCAQAHKEAILMVPEQFAFSAERLLTQQTPGNGLLTVQVLSTSRLAHRVLTAMGINRARFLDASGAQMVLGRILRTGSAQLRYYNRMRDVQALCALLYDLIRSLGQADIGAQELLALAQAAGDADLTDKVHDIAWVYAQYTDYLSGARLADAAALERSLIEALQQADFLGDTVVFADGFDLIAPLTLRLLTALAKKCRAVTVTFPCPDTPCRDAALFRAPQNAMNRLCELARAQGVPVQMRPLHEDFERPAPLAHLSRELFAVPAKGYAGPAPQITLLKAPNPDAEAAMVAAQLVRLARERGLSYGKMAVVCADGGQRARALIRQLAHCGVPYMQDHMQNAGEHPGVLAFLAALRFARGGMLERALLLRVVKCGYAHLEADALDRFENAVYEQNLFGARLLEPLEDALAEQVRQAVIPPLKGLSELLRQQDSAQAFAQAAYWYLCNSGLLNRLWEQDERQAATAIVTMLEQSHALMGEMPFSGYYAALTNGFAAATLGQIPRLADAVNISTFERFKGDDVQALFVMGANSGILPSDQAPAGLLSDLERKKLGAYLGPGGAEYFALESLTVYAVLSCVRSSVCFSYSAADAQGNPLEMGQWMRRVEQLFPGAAVIDAQQAYKTEWMLTGKSGLAATLGPMLRRGADRRWWAVLRVLGQNDPHLAQVVAKNYAHTLEKLRLEPSEARSGFGTSQSISRLEAFANCPYAHFMRYGLRPILLREPVLQRPDEGSFYHAVLEQFTRLCAPMGFELTAQQAAQRMRSITEPLCRALSSGAFAKSALGRAQIDRMALLAQRAAVEMTWHIRHSAFKPLAQEVSFGLGGAYPAIELDADGVLLILQGRIDRIDTALVGDERYLRIVDYKSGSNRLDFSRIYAGTQLQLVTYLDAVTHQRGEKGAGAFYMHVGGQVQRLEEGDPVDPESLKAHLRRSYRLEGIASSNPQVLRAMAPQDAIGDLVGVRLKKDGTPYADAPVVSQAELSALCGFVREKARSLCGRMMGGDIDPVPVQSGQALPCSYCPYIDACPHDLLSGSKVSKLPRAQDARRLILDHGLSDCPRQSE